MTKITSALSAEQVSTYYKRDYAGGNGERNYYSKGVIGGEAGEYFGREAEAFGLSGKPVTEEAIKRLAVGQDPNTGDQLIRWRPAGVEPKKAWVNDDVAWRGELERLFADAAGRRNPFVDPGEVSKPARQKVDFEAPAPRIWTEREAKLLEMHATARELYTANLAGEAGAGARMYLKERGIRPDTAKEFGLGLSLERNDQLVETLKHYGPELMRASGLFIERDGVFRDRFVDRLMIPIEAESGETIAFGARKPPNQEHGPKYVNSPSTEIYQKSDTLYNLNRAQERAHQTGQVLVVEGYLDVIAAHQAGQRNVVAQSGTALSDVQAAMLKRHAHDAVLSLDKDDAGRTATAKNIPTLVSAGLDVRVFELDGAKDSAEFLQNNKAKVYREAVRESTPLIEYLANRAREQFDTKDAYGQIDAARWMVAQLADVSAEQRAQVSKDLEAYLKIPPVEVQEAKTAVEHRAAWDLTISAPKTVSLTALSGGDERVMAAHNMAAKEAFAYAERSLQVKMGGLNAPETTQRMMGVLFVHDTARPVDGYSAPQLHTHGLIFNMSQDSTGQHRALNPKELFYLKGTVEAVYQNRMAIELKRLGFEIEYGKGLAVEIKGYTDEYRKAESARQEQIKTEKDRLDLHGSKADDLIAKNTREKKQELPPEEVRARHQARAAEFGDQPTHVIAAAAERERVTYSPEYRVKLANRAITFAKATLSERTAVMEDHEIHREALRHGRRYIALEDVEAAFEQRKAEFVEVKHWREHSPGRRWTTPELVEKETSILAFMAAGREQLPAIAGGIKREAFRERFPRLNENQEALVWNMIHSSDRMVGVQGLAGSGKTVAIGALREFVAEYGFEVRGLAQTSGAVKEMREAGMTSQTMQSLLSSKEAPAKRPMAYFVDESSLVDVETFSAFLKRTRAADRVFVVGDTKQHGSLGAGMVFKELQDAGMTTFHLSKIVRQIPAEYEDVVKQLASGNVPEALEMLDEQGRIHSFAGAQERYAAVAQEVLRSPPKTLVVSPDNSSRTDISAAIREAKQEAGQLGANIYRSRSLVQRSDFTETDGAFAASYGTGNVVLYARDIPSLGVKGGEYAAVVSVDRDKNVLTVMRENDGGVVSYNPALLGKGATVYEPSYRDFAIGDRVQFTRQWKEYVGEEGKRGTVKTYATNRQLGTIEALDDGGNVGVRLDAAEGKAGKLLRWNLEKMGHLDHGYVMTSYSAQGATTDKVIVHIDTDSPGAHKLLSENLIYVAVSRGRQDVQVFSNDRAELDRYLTRAEEKAMALAPVEVERFKGMVRV